MYGHGYVCRYVPLCVYCRVRWYVYIYMHMYANVYMRMWNS